MLEHKIEIDRIFQIEKFEDRLESLTDFIKNFGTEKETLRLRKLIMQPFLTLLKDRLLKREFSDEMRLVLFNPHSNLSFDIIDQMATSPFTGLQRLEFLATFINHLLLWSENTDGVTFDILLAMERCISYIIDMSTDFRTLMSITECINLDFEDYDFAMLHWKFRQVMITINRRR